MATKNPLELYFPRDSACGSNRTRTYDTPGMKWGVVSRGTLTDQRVDGTEFSSDPHLDPRRAGRS